LPPAPKIEILGSTGGTILGNLEAIRQRIEAAERVVVLTGAGVSAESGVPTFRGEDGLWKSFRAEDLATPEGFARDPALVWEWYAYRRRLLLTRLPNAAHKALAAFEDRRPGFLLVTQNVDGLHAAAGSRKVVELHGNIWRSRCTRCGEEAEDPREDPTPLPPTCACGGLRRPAVVFFGEALPDGAVQRALEATLEAEVALVVGTSSLVYPAAALPRLARDKGAFVVEVNPEETPLTPMASVSLRARAAETLPSLLGGRS
jgi:NAD-dependent deacetylase